MTKIKQYYSLLSKQGSYHEEEMTSLLSKLLSSKKYHHVLRVRDKAVSLAKQFQLSQEEITLVKQAALLHDLAKGMSNDELLCYATKNHIDLKGVLSPIYHAVVGAWMVKQFFSIQDSRVLEAIYYHTTGSFHFFNNKVGAILFLADYLEPGRNFHRKHIEEYIPYDLLLALREVIKDKISFVIKKNRIIDRESISFYHSILEMEEIKP